MKEEDNMFLISVKDNNNFVLFTAVDYHTSSKHIWITEDELVKLIKDLLLVKEIINLDKIKNVIVNKLNGGDKKNEKRKNQI